MEPAGFRFVFRFSNVIQTAIQTVCVIDRDNTGLRGQLTPAFSSRSRTVVFTHAVLSKYVNQVLVFSFVRSGMLRNLKIAQL